MTDETSSPETRARARTRPGAVIDLLREIGQAAPEGLTWRKEPGEPVQVVLAGHSGEALSER